MLRRSQEHKMTLPFLHYFFFFSEIVSYHHLKLGKKTHKPFKQHIWCWEKIGKDWKLFWIGTVFCLFIHTALCLYSYKWTIRLKIVKYCIYIAYHNRVLPLQFKVNQIKRNDTSKWRQISWSSTVFNPKCPSDCTYGWISLTYKLCQTFAIRGTVLGHNKHLLSTVTCTKQ